MTSLDPLRLCGTAEVAFVLGCSKQQIASLRKNPLFPKPIATLSATPLWDLDELLEFKKTWKRRQKRTADALQEIVRISEEEGLYDL